jgi:hypothetical protein
LIICVSETIDANYFVNGTSLNTLGKFIRVHDVTCMPNVVIFLHSDVDAHRDEQFFAVDECDIELLLCRSVFRCRWQIFEYC